MTFRVSTFEIAKLLQERRIALKDTIKELRNKKGLTQEQLASVLGIARVTVTCWESGQNRPRIDMIPALAKALGCSADDLLCKIES